MRLEVISEKPASASRLPPILFVHGMWFGAWCWAEHFIPFFARNGYEVHALSFRGHGRSEAVDDIRRVSLNDYLSDLIEVADRFERPPVLIGHSMGGQVVRMYLEQRCPAAVVLMASVLPFGALPAAFRIIGRWPMPSLRLNLLRSMMPLVADSFMYRELFLSDDIPEERLSEYYPRVTEDSYRAFLGMLVPYLKKMSCQDVPVLVLGAGNDMIISERDVRQTAQWYGVEAEMYPGMAHCMMLEPGWQMVGERIISWLNGER